MTTDARPAVAPPTARVAIAAIRARLARPSPCAVEHLAPAEAVGAVLAEDLCCPAPLPARDEALVDGWAVAAAETVGASPYAPAWLPARPVAAGAALPAGCDAVVRAETATATAGLLAVDTALAPGDGLRRAGSDVAAGATIAAAGRRLSPLAAHLAAAAGIAAVAVRRPTVALAVGPAAEDRRLAALLAADLRTRGARIVDADAAADLRLRLAGPALAADDPLVAAMRAAGTLDGLGLAATAAEDVACGHLGDTPCLALPARLDTLVVVARLLLDGALDHLAGAAHPPATTIRPLVRKLVSRVGVTDLALLAGAADGAWVPLATGDLPAAALLAAAAFVELPPESEGVADGTPLAALPFAFPGAAP